MMINNPSVIHTSGLPHSNSNRGQTTERGSSVVFLRIHIYKYLYIVFLASPHVSSQTGPRQVTLFPIAVASTNHTLVDGGVGAAVCSLESTQGERTSWCTPLSTEVREKVRGVLW